MQTKKSPQDQNQYVPLNDHINNTHGRKVPSRHQRHNSSSAAMESPRHHQYPYASTELQQQQQQQQASYTPPPPPQSKQVYQYDAPWPLYALDWCKTPGEQRGHRLAIGSIIEETNNKIQVIARTDTLEGSMYPPNQHSPDFTVAAEADVYYPTTKILWEPFRGSSRQTDILATTGDILRIWELVDHPRYGTTSNSINSSSGRNSPAYYMQQLMKKAELANIKQSDFCAPLTSFDWNETDPSLIVTASIDTTCTVWNVETNQAKTQLIAHDSDVYDVAFMHTSADIFASVGADGSVRLFDLRSLEHSTILYEAPSSATPINSNGAVMNPGTCPLLRLQFCRTNSNLLATFHMDSASALILDIRYPSTPVVELTKGHQGSINGVSWSPTKAGHICTGGDDGQVLVWDVNHGTDQQQQPQQQQQPSHYQQQRYSLHTPRSIHEPLLAYSTVSEINSVCWSKGVPDWIGIGFGKTVQALKV